MGLRDGWRGTERRRDWMGIEERKGRGRRRNGRMRSKEIEFSDRKGKKGRGARREDRKVGRVGRKWY